MRTLLPLALVFAAACSPELQMGEDGVLYAVRTSDKTTINVSGTCTTAECNGKTPQQIAAGGSGNGITCGSNMDECPEFPLYPFGNIYGSTPTTTFGAASTRLETSRFSSGQYTTARTMNTVSDVPAGLTITAVYKGDFYNTFRTSFSRYGGTSSIPMSGSYESLLVELSDGSLHLTEAGNVTGSFLIDELNMEDPF